MPPRMLAVVDLDGVVADVRHRLHHLSGGRKDWPAFFAAAPDDGLLAEGSETVHRLAEVYDVAYLSGRPERLRAVTQRWLHEQQLPDGQLLLRPTATTRRRGSTRSTRCAASPRPAPCSCSSTTTSGSSTRRGRPGSTCSRRPGWASTASSATPRSATAAPDRQAGPAGPRGPRAS